MTVAEMHISFKLGYDKVDSQSYPNFLPQEIDFFLNKGQEQFIATRLGPNNLLRKGFEENQRRIDDLRTLVISETLSSTKLSDKQFSIDLPDNYRHAKRAKFKYRSKTCGEGTSETEQYVQHDDLDFYLSDPFYGPFIDQPIYTFEGNQILVYTDGTFTIPECVLTYIKNPLHLSISAVGVNDPEGLTNICELPDYVHEKVVEFAISSALETIESPRTVSYQQEIMRQE